MQFNIPNILSLYRLASFPFVLYFIYKGYETTFVVIFAINQLTDIADGYIARKWNLQTEIGALLDSYADVGSYILAVFGIIKFHPYLFENYGIYCYLFVSAYILQMIICKLKYNRWVAGLHLYSSKITGYVQGIFLVVLFSYGFIAPFFYFAMIFGTLAELEAIAINLILKEPVLNAKGLWWVLRK